MTSDQCCPDCGCHLKTPLGATIKWPGERQMDGCIVEDRSSEFSNQDNESTFAKALAYQSLEIDNKDYLKRDTASVPCWFSHTENGLIVQTCGSNVPPEVRDVNVAYQMLGFMENSMNCGLISGCPEPDVSKLPTVLRKARHSLSRILYLKDPNLISLRVRRLDMGRKSPYPYDECLEDGITGYMVVAEFPETNEPGALLIPSIRLESGTLQEVCDKLDADFSPYTSHPEDCYGRTYVLAAFEDSQTALELTAFIGFNYLKVPDTRCLGADWLLDLTLLFREKSGD